MADQISLDPVETLANAILDRTPAMQRYLQERCTERHPEVAAMEAKVVAKALLEDGIVEMGRE